MFTRMLLSAMAAAVLLAGCSGRGGLSDHAEYAYVAVTEASLRDHVSTLYAKTGVVHNGERLQILERMQSKRFVRVRSPRGEEGWVQERGLYFAAEWDPHYQALFSTHDANEKPLLGGALYTRYGKGAYVFTALSFFRELPAGVPGAFRIFANFLSAGKVQTAP